VGDSVSIFITLETATTTSLEQAFGLPCRRHSKWLKRPHAVFCTARLSLGRIKNELQNLRFELWEVPWLRVGSEH